MSPKGKSASPRSSASSKVKKERPFIEPPQIPERSSNIRAREITYEPPSQYETREITEGDPYHEFSSAPESPGTAQVVLPDLQPLSQKFKKSSSMVTFSGKASEVDPVLTHCTAVFAADAITGEDRKWGYLASRFKGPALLWLTNKLNEKDYDENGKELVKYNTYSDLAQQIKDTFGLSHQALAGQQARKLASLRQKRDVQHYALEFRPLAQATNLTEPVAIATFTRGLKSHIQRALVASDDYDSLESVIGEAIRIDSELYNIRRNGGFRPRNATGRDSAGKFTKTPRYKQE